MHLLLALLSGGSKCFMCAVRSYSSWTLLTAFSEASVLTVITLPQHRLSRQRLLVRVLLWVDGTAPAAWHTEGPVLFVFCRQSHDTCYQCIVVCVTVAVCHLIHVISVLCDTCYQCIVVCVTVVVCQCHLSHDTCYQCIVVCVTVVVCQCHLSLVTFLNVT